MRACLQQWVDNGETVLIPIVLKTNDPANTPGCSTGGNGNNFTYCIVGIAAFVLTGFTQPAVDEISGRFVGTMPYSIGSTVPGRCHRAAGPREPVLPDRARAVTFSPIG